MEHINSLGPASPTEETAVCARHGLPVHRHVLQVCERTFFYDDGCSQCEQAAAEDEHLRQQQTFEIAQRRAGIPDRFRSATVEAFPIPAPGQAEVLEEARRFCAIAGKGSAGLILRGHVGTGKSHMACGILNAFLRRELSGRYGQLSDALRLLREARRWGSATTEPEALSQFCTPKLLVLDEIGVKSLEESEFAYLNEIVSVRHDRKIPTILISNQKLNVLKEHVGDRVLDRFNDGGKVLIFDWPSLRQP